MADEKKDSVEKSDPVKDTLKGVLGWLEDKKAHVRRPTSTASSAKPWGWVVGLAVAVLVFLALAFAAWRAWKKGREIAKLKHELDKKREEERQALVDAKLITISAERKKLERKAAETRKKIEDTKASIAKLETERLAMHERIDNATKWEDVERLLKE